MDGPVNDYEGKPTAYLDHNVLDLFVKHSGLPFQSELQEKYQVVYSDETLKEIKRTGKIGSRFLDVLNALGAMHFRVQVDEKFKVTGKAIIRELNAFSAFEEYCNNIEPVYEAMEKATFQSLLKFYGGRAGSDFCEINDEQISAFSGLVKDLLDKCGELEESLPGISSLLKSHAQDMQHSFDTALEQSTAELRKHVDDEANYSGVDVYRRHLKVGPVQLNNIKPPNVIEKIWDEYKDLDGYKGMGFSIEQFMGVSTSAIYNRDMYLYEKVTSAYNVLNVIGYYPDSKMKVERRFTAAMSDAGHAAMGSFCDFVFSNDKAFTRKASAVYEFLNARTKVVEVVIHEG